MLSRKTAGICFIFSLILVLAFAVPARSAGHGEGHGEEAAQAEDVHGEEHAAPGGHGQEQAAEGGHGEAGGHGGEHACPEGAICLHPHAHEIPELPSLVDFFFASRAKTVVPDAEGEIIPTEEPDTFLLKNENINFIDEQVGKNFFEDRPLESPIYSVFISNPPANLDGIKGTKPVVRFWITEVMEHELKLVRQYRKGDKPNGEKLEGPVSVKFKVKEEETLLTNVWGQGFFGLNWTDTANLVFGYAIVLLILLLAILGCRNVQKFPRGMQTFLEMIVGWLDTYTRGMIGTNNRKYLPLLGPIFLYVIVMAYSGMLPFVKSPIALNLNTPLSIAMCVFLFVQYHGIKQNGPGGYIKHLMGEPAWLAPLQMPLHIVGELIKPISLSLRLFANITAEDVLIAALAFMMVGMPIYLPIPLQTLFFPLALLFGFIQAIVFMSLSAIYISQMSSHEHHDEHEHAHH